MCGIWAVFGTALPSAKDISGCLLQLGPRGPEYMVSQQFGSVILGFTRLAINGLSPRGHQPIVNNGIAVVCNGEIYNYKDIAERWNIPLPEGCSDCEVLPTLFGKLEPTEACRALDGVFALVVIDIPNQTITVARDPYGVRPLFMGRSDGFHAFSSEIKALTPICDTVQVFPPGSWYRFTIPKAGSSEVEVSAFGYHQTPWLKNPSCDDQLVAKSMLRVAFEKAVEKRLMSDRPMGALLSGGLDSSLVCGVAAKFLRRQGKELSTFSIGMPGSTDLKYARLVADKIKSKHHEILLSKDDFFGAIPEVIKAAETYDITSVRASVGNWLIGRYIKNNTDIKVIFNGDGSDEVGGGYLYFFRAPSDEEFEAESARLLKDIYAFDVLRSDRSMASHGLEARTPFLDRQFVSVWRSIPTKYLRPTQKMKEKFILRAAFDSENLLPDEVLWRKKEAFSDGVSATEEPWHATINKFAASQIPNCAEELANAHITYPFNTPKTAEALYYRRIFEDYYGKKSVNVIPYMWMPKWSPETTDPSARTLSLY
jgi:asparagine synthase (glutamine-hydrolysing)